MAHPRLYNLIEYVNGERYLAMDAMEGTARSMGHLQPDSPEWFAWLDTLPSFHFTGKQGNFTARKDQKQRGNGYWYAYRKHRQKVYTCYLGTTEKLALAHLEQVAADLEIKLLPHSQEQ